MTRSGESDTTHETAVQPKCGIIMPISDVDGYPKGHWDDVRRIIDESLATKFDVRLVSQSDEVTVIHSTIVQNLYDDAIVVCDVSSGNPNVLFELGMRLAFDKPTVILIDDRTKFSFDTAPVEHIRYPADLRYPQIVELEQSLRSKVLSTYKIAQENSQFSPFLGHFGKTRVARIQTEEVSSQEYIDRRFGDLERSILNLATSMNRQFQKNREADVNIIQRTRESNNELQLLSERNQNLIDKLRESLSKGTDKGNS